MTLQRRDIVVRYVGTERPHIATSPDSPRHDPRELAQSVMYDFDDHRIGSPRPIIDITVDGRTFTIDELRS